VLWLTHWLFYAQHKRRHHKVSVIILIFKTFCQSTVSQRKKNTIPIEPSGYTFLCHEDEMTFETYLLTAYITPISTPRPYVWSYENVRIIKQIVPIGWSCSCHAHYYTFACIFLGMRKLKCLNREREFFYYFFFPKQARQNMLYLYVWNMWTMIQSDVVWSADMTSRG
jgi:hypothetical protein